MKFKITKLQTIPKKKKILPKIIIHIEDPESSREIQKYLFSKNIFWNSGGNRVLYTDKPTLFIQPSLNTKHIYMTYSQFGHKAQENEKSAYNLSELKEILQNG